MDVPRKTLRGFSRITAALSFLFVVFTALANAQTWTGTDIGTVGATGSDSLSGGVYTIQGAGAGITAYSDAFHFVYQTLSGDGELVARVVSVQNTNNYARAGLMVRQSNAVGSIDATISETPTVGVEYTQRTSLNGYTSGAVQATTHGAPYWLKIDKYGTLISYFRSSDGVTWTYVTTFTLSTTSPVEMGFAVSSNVAGTLCTATFDNISLISQPSLTPTSPWSDQDIGSPSQAGAVHLDQAQWSIYGGGAGLTGASDQFHFACQALSGNGVVIAQVNALSTSTSSAGVVMRQDLTTGSAEAAVLLNHTNGIAFATRATSGATITTTAGAAYTVPYWVKLVRSGSIFYGYESTDGRTWTLVGSQTLSMTGTIYIGVGATSGNNSTLALGGLAGVQVLPNGNYLPTGGISSGAYHNLYLEPNGAVWSWGLNSNGQLGNGTTKTQTSPIPVITSTGAALNGIAAVSAGGSHSLALGTDGTVWVWGNNASGQLGDGTQNSQTTSEHLSSSVLSGIVAIAAGGNHSLALANDGTVWAWGLNSNGQLGNGTTMMELSPVHVTVSGTPLTGIVAISAGGSHSLALRDDGTVWAWGNDTNGQLGNGTYTTTPQSTPVQVTTLSGMAGISAGYNHSLAVGNDGFVRAWGDDSAGEIGDGTTTTTPRTSPYLIQTSGLSSMIAVQAGNLFSVALKSDGSVWAWGSDASGQLGNGNTTLQSTAFQIPNLSGISAIGTGTIHSAALTSSGDIWTWGDNSQGQLGDGTAATSPDSNANPSVPTAGLSLWLRADSLPTSTTNVSTWNDETGNNNVTQSGSAQPTYVQSEPNANGMPGIHFNGSQSLYNADNLGLNGDMTIIEVGETSSPQTSQQYSIELGNGSTGLCRAFGYYANAQTFDTSNHPTPGEPVPNANTFVAEGVELGTSNGSPGTVTFYRNGNQMTGTPPTVPFGNLTAGITIGSNTGPYGWQGDVAEVLIYNHQLSQSEWAGVSLYLANKYGLYNPSATWPSNYSTAVQAEITRNQWNKSQADAYVALQAANPTMLTNGLKAWFKADTLPTNSSNISSWADQTGNYTVTQSTPATQPTYVANDINGEPAVRFNGTQALYNPGSLGTGVNSDLTMIAVGSTTNPGALEYSAYIGNTAGYGNRGIGYFRSQQLLDLGSGNYCLQGIAPNANTFATDAWTLAPDLSHVAFYRNGIQTSSGSPTVGSVQNVTPGLTVGGYNGYGTPWQGDIAEVLIYDHQLSTTELQQVGVYLANKYGLYNPNATWPSTYSAAVQAEITRNQWNENQANAYVALQAAYPTMLTNGLKAWFEADALPTNSTNISSWADQTGNYTVTQATGANQPTYVSNDINGKPAVRFNGSQALYNPGRLGAGVNNDMTMIAVGSTTNPSALEYSAYIGNTGGYGNRGIGYYGSQQLFDLGSNNYSLQGTAPNANTFVTDAWTLGTNLSSVTFYRNGTQTGTATMGSVQNVTSGLTVGGYNGYGTPWQGDIAEVLIYDHQLSAAEMQQVSTYLAGKYNLSMALPAPTISPNGGSFSSSATVTISSVPSPAVVRYTLNGSPPNANSTLYSGAFTLTQSAPVNAAVFLNNVEISPVTTAQFYVGDSGSIGISDAWQTLYFGHTGINPAALSPGGSGLTNLQEYLYGYNPTLFSTNGDGLSDLVNFTLGIAANDYTISGDGLTNAQNLALGIDPFNPNEAPITPPAQNPNDHTAPVITLVQPGNATLLP